MQIGFDKLLDVELLSLRAHCHIGGIGLRKISGSIGGFLLDIDDEEPNLNLE